MTCEVISACLAPRKPDSNTEQPPHAHGEPRRLSWSEVLAARLAVPLTTNTHLAEGEGSRGGFIQAPMERPRRRDDGTSRRNERNLFI